MNSTGLEFSCLVSWKVGGDLPIFIRRNNLRNLNRLKKFVDNFYQNFDDDDDDDDDDGGQGVTHENKKGEKVKL